MDEKQIQQLKKQLIEERTRLESQLASMATKNPAIKGDWTVFPKDVSDLSDSLDEKAQDVTKFEEQRAVEQSLELRLKVIDETLIKLDKGTYGICNNCNSPIAPRRLIATLAVSLCFDCASKLV